MLTAHKKKPGTEKSAAALDCGTEAQEELEKHKKYRRAYILTTKKLTLDPETIRKAIGSLQHHTLLTLPQSASHTDEYITLSITFSQPLPTALVKPVQFPLPTPIYSLANTKVCLFVKESATQIKELFNKLAPKKQLRVITYDKLTKFMSDKRKFSHFAELYELFFCSPDFYVHMPRMLKEYLGKKNKCPFPIKTDDLSVSDLMKNVYLTIRQGARFELKVARVGMGTEEAVQNVQSVVQKLVPHILLASAKHTTVQRIVIKTPSSIELPIYKGAKKVEGE